ncbi:MAG: Gfo/Idh/MocA family protein [Akkermansiaceae bacterium]
MRQIQGVIIGAGYFSRFQYEAWTRIPEITIVANCNRSLDKAETFASEFGIPKSYSGDQFRMMLETEKPDFVDIITPPETHLELCQIAAELGVTIICQKPLAPTWEETLALAQIIRESGVRFMVHENWRWQPWYREIKKLLEAGVIGEVFHCNVHTRLGDGWGDDAYMARQPFFRDYQRLFIFETGVHFLDTFRFLFGEVSNIHAQIAQRNPVIKGEDSALLLCTHQNGTTSLLDANRYNESEAENPRYTFGTVRIEGSKGHLELALDGSIRIKTLGEPSFLHDYSPSPNNFAGDCVYNIQRHFVDTLLNGREFESTVDDYLNSVELVEKAYQCANQTKESPS